jgi:hypothetical protein
MSRLVITSLSGIQRLDTMLVHQGIFTSHNPRVIERYPGLPENAMVEIPVIMAESKLKDHKVAEEELCQYTMEFSCELSTRMQFFAFATHDCGLEVAMLCLVMLMGLLSPS